MLFYDVSHIHPLRRAAAWAWAWGACGSQEANAIFQGLQGRTAEFLDTLAPAATRAAPGVQWTRAWADDGKQLRPGVDKWADGNQN